MNGRLPQSELSRVSHPSLALFLRRPGGAAAAWSSLRLLIWQKYKIDIFPGGPDSAYRTFDRQVYWKSYWTAQGHPEMAATPGGSNHGNGEAVDDPDYRQQQAILKEGAEFGWHWGEAPSEPWHFTYRGGFTRPDPGISRQYPIMRLGSGGPGQAAYVGDIQRLLGKHGYTVKVTRGFEAATVVAVKKFQRARGIKADGVVGRTTWIHLRSPKRPAKKK